MATEETKDEKKSSDGPGLFTMFAVAVAASLTVHFVVKGIEKRATTPAALPPADDWDIGGFG